MIFTRLSEHKRMVFFIIVSSSVLGILTISRLVVSYYSTDKSAQIALANQYIAIADDIAVGIDKEVYRNYLITKERDENWRIIKNYLEEYRSKINAVYVYTLMLDESNVSKNTVVAMAPSSKEFLFGSACTVPPDQVKRAKSGHSYFTGIIGDMYSGYYLSVGVPFYGDDGKILGVVGIDIDAEALKLVSGQVVKSNMFIFVIDILFAIALLIVVFVLNKWYKNRMKDDLKETEKMYLSEFGKLIDTIKSSRHDLKNHLQVLYALMNINSYDRVRDYLRGMASESKVLDLSMQIKNPVLMVLFQSKWELAQSKNINIHFDTDLNDFERVESMDLVRIFANLIDNAIEAMETNPQEYAEPIQIVCKSFGSNYVFSVENSAEISSMDEKRLFQSGFTTQNNKNGLRGNGLTIIKRTVEKYQGHIYVHYEQGKILIKITL
ncbi:GHKL domain-containing protein [Paenibacillus sp. GSMTC-2017]|uniref:GHKL domain-containing protein n=1 Tax=Paenibacillus sp. GSMTC-2017 TaxID=2794350 RepID=UPI0018D737DA|nr:GHKL domain-containing protein [Paenibacillus sp. GSMTC-2017]MBH5319601.1 GHKL domain-containing protein [Paenibacillus sp. GSMTC-2017]